MNSSFFTFLFIGITALTFSKRILASEYTYLGGASSLKQCCEIAGNAGYGKCTFGGYYNGTYIINGCFGSEPTSGGGGGGASNFETLSYEIERASFDVGWYIVDHNGDLGGVVWKALKDPYERLDKQLNLIHEKARYGLNGYDLRNEIVTAKQMYGELRRQYFTVDYLVRPTTKMYWTRLEQQMKRW